MCNPEFNLLIVIMNKSDSLSNLTGEVRRVLLSSQVRKCL